MIRELTVGQTIDEIKKLKARLQELEDSLILRAQLQRVIEIDYNTLLKVVKEGVGFLEICQIGDVIDEEWIRKRDAFYQKARQYTLDVSEGEAPSLSESSPDV